MSADPERYLSADALDTELPFGPYDIGVDDSEEDTDGNTDWDNLLLRVLRRESDRIDEWTGTTFGTATASKDLSRPENVDDRHLPLPARPVQSVQSVTADDKQLTEGQDYAVEKTHLVLLENAPLRQWPTDYMSVSVEWTYGQDSVPSPVEDALVRLCRNAIERIQTDGLESESTGDGASYSYRLPAAITAEAKSTVDDYAAPSYYGGAQVI